MRLEEKKEGGRVVIQLLESRLAADKAIPFKAAMEPYLAMAGLKLVLDVSFVQFIDSSGLGAILWVLKRIPADGKMVLCGATGSVAGMLKLTHMERVLNICGTLEEATASFAGSSGG